MSRVTYSLAILLLTLAASAVLAASFFHDDFPGPEVSDKLWHIPTWEYNGDGTFIGRTQFRCTQNSGLPSIVNNNVMITVETYNPTGSSFYGTDLISNPTFAPGRGVHMTVRAKMDTTVRGIVGGIFFYSLATGSSTLHDEIDFEILTNRPDGVQTNIYANEPLGAGHSQFVPFPNGSISDYHIYEIIWLPDKVMWRIDGHLVRTETVYVPEGPMEFHLNMWVPAADWVEAYSGSLKWVDTLFENTIFSMRVDYVDIRPFLRDMAPVYQLLLLDELQ